MRPLQDFPDELLGIIASSLDLEDLRNFRAACSSFCNGSWPHFRCYFEHFELSLDTGCLQDFVKMSSHKHLAEQTKSLHIFLRRLGDWENVQQTHQDFDSGVTTFNLATLFKHLVNLNSVSMELIARDSAHAGTWNYVAAVHHDDKDYACNKAESYEDEKSPIYEETDDDEDASDEVSGDGHPEQPLENNVAEYHGYYNRKYVMSHWYRWTRAVYGDDDCFPYKKERRELASDHIAEMHFSIILPALRMSQRKIEAFSMISNARNSLALPLHQLELLGNTSNGRKVPPCIAVQKLELLINVDHFNAITNSATDEAFINGAEIASLMQSRLAHFFKYCVLAGDLRLHLFSNSHPDQYVIKSLLQAVLSLRYMRSLALYMNLFPLPLNELSYFCEKNKMSLRCLHVYWLVISESEYSDMIDFLKHLRSTPRSLDIHTDYVDISAEGKPEFTLDARGPHRDDALDAAIAYFEEREEIVNA